MTSVTPRSESLVATDAMMPNSANLSIDETIKKRQFLFELIERFESEGNLVEAIKGRETALLLRRSAELSSSSATAAEDAFGPVTTLKEAQDLVLLCNTFAVADFQRGQFDTASFLLNKALFLTEEYSKANCFANAEHDRLRLRAATLNNLGCMEKRRDRLHASLDYLQRAAQLEITVDPDVGASPSTHLNLCTILNKLGNHVAATAAAQRAVVSLKVLLQQQASIPAAAAAGVDAEGGEAPQGNNTGHLATMLTVAQYNLAVSLESGAQPGSNAEAIEAYEQVLYLTNRYHLDPSAPSAVNAREALRRLQGGVAGGGRMLPALTQKQRIISVAPPMVSRGPLTGSVPRRASSNGRAPSAAGTDRGTPDSMVGSMPRTPAPPTGAGGAIDATKHAPSSARPFRFRMMPIGSGNSDSSDGRPMTVGGIGSGLLPSALGEAALKHAERIQAKHRKKEAHAERDQQVLARAQRAHQKEKEEKLRREREMEAHRREETAQALYEKMVNGLRAEEIRRVKNAAKKLQKLWRGTMARSLIRRMQQAATKIQGVVRSFLTRLRLQRAVEEKRLSEVREALAKKQFVAAVTIQRRVRLFLHRLAILRNYKAKIMRRVHSAVRVQRCFRQYQKRREQRITAQLEAERYADERRFYQQNEAAKKIQSMFRSFKTRRLTRIISMEQKRRARAAAKIQALIRGKLTRVWFFHFKLYRRQQELSSSANLRQIVRIQAVWRAKIARTLHKRLLTKKRLDERKRLLFVSARRIQCAWRCYDARQRVRPLQRRHEERKQAARKIESTYKVYKIRQAYLVKRDAARKVKAAILIQRWFQQQRIVNRHKEDARYHARILRQQRIALLRTEATLLVQSMMQARLSSLIVESMRNYFNKMSRTALIIQKACRGFQSNQELSVLRDCAKVIDEEHRVQTKRHRAASIIQRATRCYLAKVTAATKRRRRAAALMIQSDWRMHVAQKELGRLRRIQQNARHVAAVRVMQRLARKFLKKLQLRRLDEFYAERNRQRLMQLRREEASTAIQSVWRGHATRVATTAERNRLLQNTIDALRIQRCFRAFRFRKQINVEIGRRILLKRRQKVAAVRLQSFWRAVLAREYVAVLREERYQKSVCSICIQCAWRRYQAIKELMRRREARQTANRLRAQMHDMWIDGVTVVQAYIRGKQSERHRNKTHKSLLVRQVLDSQREKRVREHMAATAIQAVYRGHYERVYARGLRREKAEKERLIQLQADKERKAACVIQRAWRSYKARVEVTKRREDRNMKHLAAQIERESIANPHDLVQQLFWSHEAAVKRDLTRERRSRHTKQEAAAICIQKNVRVMLAVKKYKKTLLERNEEAASVTIQQFWRRQKEEVRERDEQRHTIAAVAIQAMVRGVLTRLNWRAQQRVMSGRRMSSVVQEDLQDRAAITIQSAWRRVRAVRYANALRWRRDLLAVEKKRNEAAKLIQRTYRRHTAWLRYEKTRAQK